jgi:hypothetical protein
LPVRAQFGAEFLKNLKDFLLTFLMNQKTVQMALMELGSTKPDVKWKKIGGYRLFWKERPK